MSYIVSARKYRPKTFEDVVGQDQITTTLKRSIENDHLAQAFLFCGPRGVGKTTCARIMAKAVNTGQTEKLDEIEEDFSFNIFELDAASNNKVDDMHQLIAQVRIPPQTGKYKIYIIDEVHMLSQAAFNAFLKTLEEPPPYAIFILATTEKHKILPTILSRCQIYDFKRISVIDIVKHLQNIASQENIVADESALHIIAEKADGALRDALSIFDRLVSFSGDQLTYEAAVKGLNVLDYDYFFKITEYLLLSDLSNALLALDEILNNGFEADHFIQGLSGHFRNLLVCKDPKTIKLLELSERIKQLYFDQAGMTPKSFLVNALSLASDADVNYAASINKRLLVEGMLMKMAFLINLTEGKSFFGDESAEKKKLEQKLGQILNAETHTQAPAPVEAPLEAHEQVNEQVNEEPTPKVEEEIVAEQTPAPPKETTPKASTHFSLDDLEKQVEEELNAPVVEEENEIEESGPVGSLELTEENLQKVWHQFLDSLAEENNQSLLHSINDKSPSLDEGKINLVADSKVEATLIKKELLRITAYLRSNLAATNIDFNIVVEENEKKQKVILNQKDKFQRMAQSNPTLTILIDKLNLELER
ncbi:MAG: DNA polymerase-3 subunit gamma/tau [Chitinophagales bacterium]|jgi:DNA polymerase-3 subunit gamma/tau